MINEAPRARIKALLVGFTQHPVVLHLDSGDVIEGVVDTVSEAGNFIDLVTKRWNTDEGADAPEEVEFFTRVDLDSICGVSWRK